MTMRSRFVIWSALALALACAMSSGAVAAEKAPLTLKKGDRIILIGNTLAERMQYFGNFATLLHSRFPDLDLVFHNLGWSADELTLRPRSRGFEDHGHTLKDEKPDVVIAAFGFNESFAGPAGLDKFKRDLEAFVKESTSTSYNGKTAPRLVLLSPIAQENLGDEHIVDGKANNANVKLYTQAMGELAKTHNVIFVDLFTPSSDLMDKEKTHLTINGIHLNEFGDEKVATVLDAALFGPRPAAVKADLARLKAEILEKDQQFWYDYRAINGCYIYGGRKAPFGIVNFPAEFAKLRKMVEVREKRVWDVSKGNNVPDQIDDRQTGELVRVETNAKKPIRLTTPEESRKTFKLPEGYEINLFASEQDFPDLKKPVQMTFDARGVSGSRRWGLIRCIYRVGPSMIKFSSSRTPTATERPISKRFSPTNCTFRPASNSATAALTSRLNRTCSS